jgi:hypothetical protein
VRRRCELSVAAAATALVLGTAGPAAAGDEVIATLPPQTAIDALGGHVLWSVPDATGKSWRLVDFSHGTQHELPLRPSSAPFDVDLGRDSKGRVAAVYSRCRKSLEAGARVGRRGCDVFRYGIAKARETKVRRIDSPRSDEYEPTQWGPRIAFLRDVPRRHGQRAAAKRMYVRDLRPGGRTRLLGGGSAEGSAGDLDQRWRQTALSWIFDFSSDARLARAGHRGRPLLETPGSGAAAQEYSVLHPTFADSHTVYWGLTSRNPDWGEVWRRDLRKRRNEHATTRIPAPLVRFAQDGHVSYYALDNDSLDDTSPLELHRLDGLAFERAPKLTLH